MPEYNPDQVEPVTSHPFIGEVKTPFRNFNALKKFVARLLTSPQPTVFQAVHGRVQESEAILAMPGGFGDDTMLATMIPHRHTYDALLWSLRTREGPTVVLPPGSETRSYLRGDLDFKGVQAIQKSALDQCELPAYLQNWCVDSAGISRRLEVPFLLVINGAPHFRMIEDEEQYGSRSELSNWTHKDGVWR